MKFYLIKGIKMEKVEKINTNKEMIEIYRKILGNEYNDANDEEIIKLANRIKWFCRSLINSHPKNFSDKSKNKLLSFQSEKNE